MIALDPVFNDVSRLPLAANSYQAGDRVGAFIDVLVLAPRYGLGTGLRVAEDFHLTEIGVDFRLFQWLDHPATTRDKREFLLSLATSMPFMKGSEESAQERAYLTEYSVRGDTSSAIQAAHLLNLPLVSLKHAQWDQPTLDAVQEELGDDGELTTQQITLVNFSQEAHLAMHSQWIADRRRESFADPKQLWDQRREVFPSLDFSDNAKTQLLGFSVNEDMFQQTLSRLFELQRVAALGAPFSTSAFRCQCKSSSEATLNKFGAEYAFRSSSGETIICPWHLNLPDGRRIYFGVLRSKYFVGHIGKHLPTTQFP